MKRESENDSSFIVNLISGTSNTAGLKVQSELNTNEYPAGRKVTDKELKQVRINPDRFHGDWNYMILPKSRSSSVTYFVTVPKMRLTPDARFIGRKFRRHGFQPPDRSRNRSGLRRPLQG